MVLIAFILCFCIAAEGKSSFADKWTGEYHYKLGSQESTLYVKQITAEKIRFGMLSVWVGNRKTGQVHTGQAAGTFDLANDAGTYKEENMSLNFQFSPGHCQVKCEGQNYYGGMNVDPDGVYKRVNQKTPTEDQLSD
jgi:hypothetical protein